jgi:hypothetical protein
MKKSILKFIVYNLIILITSNAFAQLPGDQNTSGNLENTDSVAPINDYLIPMLVAGVLFSFYMFKKKLSSIKR